MDSKPELRPNPETRISPRKRYQKPEFQYERVFETMALACGKTSPHSVNCHHNRKNS